MKVSITTILNSTERKIIEDEFQIVFRNGTFRGVSEDIADLLVVSQNSFLDQEISNKPFITPTVVHNMCCLDLSADTFNFPKKGLANLHLYRKNIAFSGLSVNKRNMLKRKCECMGGIVNSFLTKDTKFLVVGCMQTKKVEFANENGITIVKREWIDELFTSLDYFGPQDPFPSPLYGLNIAYTCLNSESIDQINNLIGNGTVETHGFNANTDYVITSQYPTSKIARIAIHRDIQLIRLSDVQDALNGKELLGMAPPVIQSNVFKGSKFLIKSRHPDKARRSIKENGGTIVTFNPTFIISDTTDGSDICRTEAWLERCIETNEILDADAFPLASPQSDFEPCDGLSASISGLDGVSYLNIIAVLRWMGIAHHRKFTPKSTSFLIAPNKEARLFQPAVSYNVPVYTPEALSLLALLGPNADLTECTLFKPSAGGQKVTSLPNTASLIESNSDDEGPIMDSPMKLTTRIAPPSPAPIIKKPMQTLNSVLPPKPKEYSQNSKEMSQNRQSSQNFNDLHYVSQNKGSIPTPHLQSTSTEDSQLSLQSHCDTNTKPKTAAGPHSPLADIDEPPSYARSGIATPMLTTAPPGLLNQNSPASGSSASVSAMRSPSGPFGLVLPPTPQAPISILSDTPVEENDADITSMSFLSDSDDSFVDTTPYEEQNSAGPKSPMRQKSPARIMKPPPVIRPQTHQDPPPIENAPQNGKAAIVNEEPRLPKPQQRQEAPQLPSSSRIRQRLNASSLLAKLQKMATPKPRFEEHVMQASEEDDITSFTQAPPAEDDDDENGVDIVPEHNSPRRNNGLDVLLGVLQERSSQ